MVLDGDKHRLEGLGLWDLIASLSRSAYGGEWDINNFENGWALMRCDCQEGRSRAGEGEVVESRLSLYMAYLRLVHSIVVDNICIRLREALKGGSNPFPLLLDSTLRRSRRQREERERHCGSSSRQRSNGVCVRLTAD